MSSALTSSLGPLGVGCRAVAHSNIALAKYWGKRDRDQNLPDVPSLSLTLSGLSTITHVRFDALLDSDTFVLNGQIAHAESTAKVSRLLDRVRRAAGLSAKARVESTNDFPTAAGLASSASGFAALALASTGAAGLSWAPTELSELARASSVSAARSIFGGFVALEAGAKAAEPLNIGERGRDLRMVIAVTDTGPKAIGSTSGMLHTQDTSPYYAAWREAAGAVYDDLRGALLRGDLQQLGEAMEHSTLLMHASMLGAKPAILYWNPATLRAMQVVRELRAAGTLAYFTMDAGPHVKVLTVGPQSETVRASLAALDGVRRVIVTGGGAGARLLEAA